MSYTSEQQCHTLQNSGLFSKKGKANLEHLMGVQCHTLQNSGRFSKKGKANLIYLIGFHSEHLSYNCHTLMYDHCMTD